MGWEEDQAAIFGAATQEELNERMRAMAAQGAEPPAQPPERRRPPRPQPNQGFLPMMGDHGLHNAMAGMNASNAISALQGRTLGGMISQTANALQDENEKRAAIAREMRRMEHERQLKAMEQETERMKIDALLARLKTQGADGGMMFSHRDGRGWEMG